MRYAPTSDVREIVAGCNEKGSWQRARSLERIVQVAPLRGRWLAAGAGGLERRQSHFRQQTGGDAAFGDQYNLLVLHIHQDGLTLFENTR